MSLNKAPSRSLEYDEMVIISQDGELWVRFINEGTLEVTLRDDCGGLARFSVDALPFLKDMGDMAEHYPTIMAAIERERKKREAETVFP